MGIEGRLAGLISLGDGAQICFVQCWVICLRHTWRVAPGDPSKTQWLVASQAILHHSPSVVAIANSKEHITMWWKTADHCIWRHWQWWPQEKFLGKSLNWKNTIAPPIATELNHWWAKPSLGKQCGDKKKGSKTGRKKMKEKNTKQKR